MVTLNTKSQLQLVGLDQSTVMCLSGPVKVEDKIKLQSVSRPEIFLSTVFFFPPPSLAGLELKNIQFKTDKKKYLKIINFPSTFCCILACVDRSHTGKGINIFCNVPWILDYASNVLKDGHLGKINNRTASNYFLVCIFP